MTAPRLVLAFLIYFPPPIAQEITVTSFYDVTIICSTFSMGKPLHMHGENAIIHLCIHRHHCQNPSYYCYTQTTLSFPYAEFHACDTLPQVFQCALVPEPQIYFQHLRTDTKHRQV